MYLKLTKHWKIIAFVLAIVCSTLFIISNSLMDSEASHGVSNGVIELLIPEKYQDSSAVSFVVRKAGHLIEFAILGTIVMSLALFLQREKGKSFIGYALFYVLSVGVMDEHVQSFSDRTSSTDDIFLDFCGALLGFAVAVAIRFLVSKLKDRKQK